MGCGASAAAVPVATGASVDFQVKNGGFHEYYGWVALTGDGKNKVLFISNANLGNTNDDIFKNPLELWIRSSLKESDVHGKATLTDGESSVTELRPSEGTWAAGPEGTWKSTRQSVSDTYRYSWVLAREAKVQSGDGQAVASLKVIVSGITRVECYSFKSAKDPYSMEGVLVEKKGHLKYYPVIGTVTIELVKEGTAEPLSMQTGTDGWNEGFSGVKEGQDISEFGKEKIAKKFTCELFDAECLDSGKAKVTAKPGLPPAQSLFLAFLMAYGMHPAKMMKAMDAKVQEKCNEVHKRVEVGGMGAGSLETYDGSSAGFGCDLGAGVD